MWIPTDCGAGCGPQFVIIFYYGHDYLSWLSFTLDGGGPRNPAIPMRKPMKLAKDIFLYRDLFLGWIRRWTVLSKSLQLILKLAASSAQKCFLRQHGLNMYETCGCPKIVWLEYVGMGAK